MSVLVVAIALALLFDVSNGFHDSANAIAALVATGAAPPGAALVLAASFHVLGPLIAGTAVADTIGGILVLPQAKVVPVVGAAVTAAVLWNVITWWRGLPSSSSHGLVGGLVGAAWLAASAHAIRWGGVNGLRPVGVVGVLVSLLVSPVLGFLVGLGVSRLAQRGLRRARREIERPIRRAEWVTAATLAFSHGANDAQKTMGVITLLLVATGHLSAFRVPLWVKLAAATSLTVGTGLGGWRIVRTVGSGIFRIRPLDGLVSQASSAAVILSAAALGGPVSTTHVVASSIVGVGSARRRRHVRWAVVREMALAWILTVPATAALGALLLPAWRAIS